jgi:hypothetical protein
MKRWVFNFAIHYFFFDWLRIPKKVEKIICFTPCHASEMFDESEPVRMVAAASTHDAELKTHEIDSQFLTACKCGDIKAVMEMANKCTIEIRTSGFDEAYMSKKLDVVAYLLSIETHIIPLFRFEKSCKDGEIEMAKILQSHMGDSCIGYGLVAACRAGQLEIVNWLCIKHNVSKFTDEGFFEACRGGHRAIAAKMFEYGAMNRIAITSNGVYSIERMSDAIRLSRANGWIDIADQFSTRLAIITAPLTFPIDPRAIPENQSIVHPGQSGPKTKSIAYRLACITTELQEIAAELDGQK